MIIPTHPCPGGCGCELVCTQFACGPCWRRLPYRLRMDILHHQGVTPRIQRLRAAREWFAANPPPPDRTPPHQLRGAAGQYVSAGSGA